MKAKAEVESEKKKTETKVEKRKVAGAICDDKDCHIHGNLKVRGRIFEGKIIKKFHKRITIEFERMIYVRKYERYSNQEQKFMQDFLFAWKKKLILEI